jgi:catechol 2,3-dioxygenase-like lactoylglutathione lyase family enzyme
MPLTTLDHVNLRTHDLDRAVAWYRDVLGMETGPRPDFSFDGAWMYLDGKPIVHLIKVAREPDNVDPKLEHFAIGATGMAAFLETLERHGVAHTLDPVPGLPVVQVNLRDCDGNHIHVDFAAEEAEAVR